MEYYMDEKRKLSREDTNCQSSKSSFSRSISQRGSSTTTSKSPFSFRSLSQKHSPLSRSSSQKNNSPPQPSNLSKSSSQKGSNIKRKCSTMAKEQKAKFYIAKRCIAMLVFWKKNGD